MAANQSSIDRVKVLITWLSMYRSSNLYGIYQSRGTEYSEYSTPQWLPCLKRRRSLIDKVLTVAMQEVHKELEHIQFQ
jgi:hypothetical protein